MRKKTVTNEDNKSIKKVIIFCLIVALLIVISSLIRFAIVLKESKYNGKNIFTLAIQQSQENATIIAFDPGNDTLSQLTIQGKYNNSIQSLVGIPLDGTIQVKNLPLIGNPSEELFSLILHPT